MFCFVLFFLPKANGKPLKCFSRRGGPDECRLQVLCGERVGVGANTVRHHYFWEAIILTKLNIIMPWAMNMYVNSAEEFKRILGINDSQILASIVNALFLLMETGNSQKGLCWERRFWIHISSPFHIKFTLWFSNSRVSAPRSWLCSQTQVPLKEVRIRAGCDAPRVTPTSRTERWA